MNALIYDVEIIRCIPQFDPEPDLEYCGGWDDHAGMGISVIAAYDYAEGVYRIFFEDNLDDFQALVRSSRHVIGFNSSAFDDPLCRAHGLEVTTTYDLLTEVRLASGQPPGYVRGVTRRGYSLDSLAVANLPISKSSSGAVAPVLWQRGRRGAVTDYALRDVQITRALFERRMALRDPTTGVLLMCREPEGWG